MATVKDQVTTKLAARVESGVDEATGKNVYSTRSLSSVVSTLSDDDCRLIISGYADLQNYPVHSLSRIDSAVLLEA